MRWVLLSMGTTAALAALALAMWPHAVLSRMPEITVTGSALPRPSGVFGVGRTSVSLPATDRERHAYTVDLWYPTPSGGTPAVQLGGTRTGSGLSKRARAGAVVDAAVAPLDAPLPLLIYAPGWDGPRWANTFMLANLASHGYVVAAIDDVGFSASGVAPPDLGEFDLSTDETSARSFESANKRLRLMVARVSATIDGLASFDRTGRLAVLGGRVDYARVGMLGFSFGGAVAAESALSEPRLVAVANMDGWLFGASATTIIEKPYLVFNSDFPTIEEDAKGRDHRRRISAQVTLRDRAQQALQALRPDAVILLFKQVDHADFTDDLFSPQLASYLKRWRRTSDARLRLGAAQDAYLLAFFNRHLRGSSASTLLRQSPPPFPGVEFLLPSLPASR